MASLRRLLFASLALLTAGPALAQQFCGPVILAGHDADDHGFETVYATLFDAIFANVTNGGTGILSIGAQDPGSSACTTNPGQCLAGTWIADVAALMAQPQTVTFINGIDVTSTPFDGYAIIHLPSDDRDTPGGITQSESDLFTLRRPDIAAFVNGGGGIFGLTQGELTGGWNWLDGVGSVTHMDAPPSGRLPSGGSFDNVKATPQGTVLGITDTNLDGCCFHNVFLTFPGFLSALALADEVDDPSWDNEAVFIGGVSICVSLTFDVEFDWVRADKTAAGIEVRWQTLSEEDTLGFVLQRAVSEDGRDAQVVGQVIAHGANREYSLLDLEPSGSHYYWVQELTTSGPGDRSPVVSVGRPTTESKRSTSEISTSQRIR